MTFQLNSQIFVLLRHISCTDCKDAACCYQCSAVCFSARLSIGSSWTQAWALQKRKNRSGCGLGCAKGIMYQVKAWIPTGKKVKVAHSRLPSVGFRSLSRFLAVSLRVTRVINPAVGCHYFPPGPQLPSQPLRGLLPFSLLGKQRHDGCEQFV